MGGLAVIPAGVPVSLWSLGSLLVGSPSGLLIVSWWSSAGRGHGRAGPPGCTGRSVGPRGPGRLGRVSLSPFGYLHWHIATPMCLYF